MSDISHERGAGVEAMRAQRATSVAPPPLPAANPAPTIPAPAEDPAVDAASEEEAGPAAPSGPETSGQRTAEATSTRRKKKPSSDEELIGQPKGNLRQISVRLPQQLRNLLDADNSADPDLSLGLIGMDAVRRHVSELLAESRDEGAKVDDKDFAPRRRVVRRSARGPKIPTPMSVTPEEARRLGELRDELGMSVNLIIERSLERYYSVRLG